LSGAGESGSRGVGERAQGFAKWPSADCGGMGLNLG